MLGTKCRDDLGCSGEKRVPELSSFKMRTWGSTRVTATAVIVRSGCGLLRCRKMFVDKTIEGERSRALDYHYQRQCDRQQMVLNPVSWLVSEPVQEKAKSEMNSCNSAHHRER